MSATPQEALELLLEGNRRFVANNLTNTRWSPQTRQAQLAGQSPTACILGCSDSRVPPQLVFDQGLGDLFMVRVAGNLLDDVALGSLEFALLKLEVPLAMVLGHEDCGAIKATLDEEAAAGEPSGYLHHLTDRIRPVLKHCKDPTDASEAVRVNAREVARRLRAEPLFANRIAEGRLLVVSACYDLASGEVEIIER